MSQSLKKCYVPALKKLVQIKFFIAYYIQDRVEHCEFTGFSSHNGICSTIPGFSCPILIGNNSSSCDKVTLVKQIHSCDGCFQRRLLYHFEELYNESFRSKYSCHKCCDWDVDKVEFHPHEDYPIEFMQNNIDGSFKSKKITYETMIQACDIMFEKFTYTNGLKK